MARNCGDVVIGYPAAQNAALSRSGHCFSCSGWGCRSVCFLLIAFFVYIGSVWFVLPAPSEASIASASVASFNISSFPMQLSADFNVTLSVHNPSNVFSHHYKGVGAAMLYGSTVLAGASLPDFHLSKRSSTTLSVALAAAAEPNVAFGEIRHDLETNGAVVFRFDMWAPVTFGPRVLDFASVSWGVICDGITIWFDNGTGPAGSTVGPPTSCVLHQWDES